MSEAQRGTSQAVYPIPKSLLTALGILCPGAGSSQQNELVKKCPQIKLLPAQSVQAGLVLTEASLNREKGKEEKRVSPTPERRLILSVFE